MKDSLRLATIPALFYVMFFVFGFTQLNNFWLNYSGFLPAFPPLMTVIGSIGILLLIVFLNLFLSELLFDYFFSKKKYSHHITFILTAILLFILLATPLFMQDPQSEGTLQVMGVQGNLDQDWFERRLNSGPNYDHYANLTHNALRQYPQTQVVLWPEYVFSHDLEFDTVLQGKLMNISTTYNVTLVIGSLRLVEPGGRTNDRYNTLFIFDRGELQLYDAYEPVTVFDPEVRGVDSNNPIIFQGADIGLSLCYEENFPYVFAKQIREQDAQIFFLIGNQYFLSNEKGLELTALNAKLRAVESQKYLFRLETSGLSAVIAPDGSYVTSLPLREEGILLYEVPLIKQKTLYSQYQIIIEVVLLLLALLPLVVSLMRSKN